MAEKNTYLGAADVRSMAEITQSPLQQQDITSRWLLKVLPWVDVVAGVYQVNRSKTPTEDTRISSGCKHDEDAKELPKTAAFPENPSAPCQYDLSVVQTILELQSRAVDLYNEPYNTTTTQIQSVVESLREEQENQMINNPDFGLLHAASSDQRITSPNGHPTPDALDNLISIRRGTEFIFAHPKTIAAFGRECNKQGLAIQNIPLGDTLVPSWRSVPLLSCNKIPVSEGKSSIIAMRTGEHKQGVIGLRPKTLPDQTEPGVNIRFMGINNSALISYLISSYFSVAILVPSALGILEDVEIQ